MRHPLPALLLAALRLYRLAVSPVIHFLLGPSAGCRFTPSCSLYAMEAVQKHGALRGGWLAGRRLCRCHPWGDCGHDPVPEASSSACLSSPCPLK